MNLVDYIAPAQRFTFRRFARDITYKLADGASAPIKGFIRGVREQDLFAGAFQQDQVVVIDAQEWSAAFPSRLQPQRFDRIVTPNNTQSYSVESFRGSPNDGFPVFFKLLVRGGQQ
jgi:hypothetical protein